jgi:SNF2 family DNA or RNA helicase
MHQLLVGSAVSPRNLRITIGSPPTTAQAPSPAAKRFAHDCQKRRAVLFEPFDQVMTLDGRVGVVRSINGSHATVLLGSAQEEHALSDLSKVGGSPADSAAAGLFGDTTRASLRLQAKFLRHAYRYDLRSGLSNARIEPKLHQVFVAHRVATKLQPRMILADEVGLGKTIEAGLVLKELRARGTLERVLIVCPASLQYQWQHELASKFNEDFTLMDAPAARHFGQGGTNPFSRQANIITSVNYVQSDRRIGQILEVPWDLVIFDEAHRIRRWLAGSSPRVTRAYRLADELKELVDGILLLTATPMQLHHYELYSLVELIEPGLFDSFEEYDRRRKLLPALNDLMRGLKEWNVLSPAERSNIVDVHRQILLGSGDRPLAVDDLDPESAREAVMDSLVQRHPLAQVMIRNRKAEIGGFAGREASRILVELTPDELELYEDVAEYLRHGYNRAVASNQNAVGFLMVTYQKMLASSPYCIMQSFRRRVDKLQQRLAGANTQRPASKAVLLDDLREELEDADVLESYEDKSLQAELVNSEIADLENLIHRLENLPGDTKADELLAALDEIWTDNPTEKVVIFTSFRDTQTYLAGLIEEHLTIQGRPAKVARFNGILSLDQKEQAIRHFRNDRDVLISTEAGGEGRNLQFAHILINYDLPWNPMKVEQRIGRLDRIGQSRTVFIYNLACAKTIEERILDVLDQRIQLFSEAVGSLDPILGDLEGRLAELIMRHSDQFDIEFDNFESDIERQTLEARENERVLADLVLDRASFRQDRATELLGATPLATARDLESFVGRCLDYFGGTLMEHAEGGQQLTLSPRLASTLHVSASQYRGVFDPEQALSMEDLPFLAIGHSIIDELLDLAAGNDDHTAVEAVEGLTNPRLELIYQLRAETIPPVGRIMRHVVGADLRVTVEEVDSMPAPKKPASGSAPEWIEHALEASRDRYLQDLRALEERIRSEEEAKRSERLSRAERIFDYRRKRLLRLIDDQQRWLDDADPSVERIARIRPARAGKLRADREQLDGLDAKFESECNQIKSERPAVAGGLWSVVLQVPPQ